MPDLLLDPFLISVPENPSPTEARKFVDRLSFWITAARETGLSLVALDRYVDQLHSDGTYPRYGNLGKLLANQDPKVLNEETITMAMHGIQTKSMASLKISDVLLDEKHTKVWPPHIGDRLSEVVSEVFKESLASCALYQELTSSSFPDFFLTDVSPEDGMAAQFKVEEAEYAGSPDLKWPRAINAKWQTFDDSGMVLESILSRLQGDCGSLYEAVRKVQDEFVDDLVFLPKALHSAEGYGYPNVQGAYRALKVLGEVGKLYHQDKLDNQGIGDAIKQRLGQNSYAGNVSQQAQNNFSTDYEITYKGKKEFLGPHIKLGKAKAAHILRIYFYIDREEKQFIVGHVGKHLPY